VRRRAARVGSRGVFLCRLVIAGLMVDGGEVMALGGLRVVLGRCQVVLRGWMLKGHIGPRIAVRPPGVPRRASRCRVRAARQTSETCRPGEPLTRTDSCVS